MRSCREKSMADLWRNFFFKYSYIIITIMHNNILIFMFFVLLILIGGINLAGIQYVQEQ